VYDARMWRITERLLSRLFAFRRGILLWIAVWLGYMAEYFS
jgi:hypothetical protein